MRRNLWMLLLAVAFVWRPDGSLLAEELDAVLRQWSDDRAFFAMGLAEKEDDPGAVDFFTEALRLLPEDDKWDARRAEYAHQLAEVVKGLERIEGLEPEDRQHLMAAAEAFTRGSRSNVAGFHPLRLKTIIIPKVEFIDTPFSEALDQIAKWSRDFDPEGVGIEIERKFAIAGAPFAIGEAPIFLRLSNVPLEEALRYTCSLAEARYVIGDQSVLVEPRTAPPLTELPSYLIRVEAPLVTPLNGDARSSLEERGFSFPQGGGAIYVPGEGALFVKVKEEQLPGIVLWLRAEETFRDKAAVYRQGIARMARAEVYAKENLMAASEDRIREALGCFVWLERNHKDFRSTEIRERIAELRKRLRHASP